jgi:hypothetical protein
VWNVHSASQEILCPLWKPKVHFLVYKSLICNILKQVFLWWGVVIPSPNPRVGGPPFFGFPRPLIQYIPRYSPYLVDICYIHNPRMRHALVTESHITLSQSKKSKFQFHGAVSQHRFQCTVEEYASVSINKNCRIWFESPRSQPNETYVCVYVCMYVCMYVLHSCYSLHSLRFI